MKTAVSIPTPLFEKAERKARKLGISRSKLYAQALEKMFKEDEEEESELTREINAAIEGLDTSIDPVLAELGYRALRKYSEW